jgi:hypothetical protein
MGRRKKEPEKQEIVSSEEIVLNCSLCGNRATRLTFDSSNYYQYKNLNSDKIVFSFIFNIHDEKANKVGVCDDCLQEKKKVILTEFLKKV